MTGVLVIGGGYLALIATWGWKGLAVAIVHAAVMLLAA
jgi:hypothetical protein